MLLCDKLFANNTLLISIITYLNFYITVLKFTQLLEYCLEFVFEQSCDIILNFSQMPLCPRFPHTLQTSVQWNV